MVLLHVSMLVLVKKLLVLKHIPVPLHIPVVELLVVHVVEKLNQLSFLLQASQLRVQLIESYFLLLPVKVNELRLLRGLQFAHLVDILSLDGNAVDFVLLDGADHPFYLVLFVLKIKSVHDFLHELVLFDLRIFLHLLIVFFHLRCGVFPLSQPFLVQIVSFQEFNFQILFESVLLDELFSYFGRDPILEFSLWVNLVIILIVITRVLRVAILGQRLELLRLRILFLKVRSLMVVDHLHF